jgi:replication factor C small subunit
VYNSIMKELWTEKYRPDALNDYVFRDSAQKNQVQGWVDSGAIPHLLFSGSPGVGKTTLAKILIKQLGINEYDILEINASRENSVDNVREKITNFVATMPFGEFKIVLLDEADYISPNGQAALRGVMETYASTARFILTCNYPNKVIPALHSRCQGFHIDKIDTTEFTARIATVLVTEQVEIDIDTLDSYVKATYPDLRKCLNLVQMNTVEGKLLKPQESDNATADYRLAVVDLFKQGKIMDARKMLCSQVRPEEMDEVFRWMYDNLELWGETQEEHDAAILIIAKGLRAIPLVADQEINLSATLVELCQIRT